MFFENRITSTEANQRFTQTLRETDKRGITIITKNGKPAYVLITYTEFEKMRGDIDLMKEEFIKEAMSENGVWVMRKDVNVETFSEILQKI